MTLLRTLTLFLAVTLAVSFASGQDGDQNIHQSVLEKGIADSTFIFGNWSKNGNTETHLKYLGQVTAKHGQTFKIINSTMFWGLSRRATSRILIFNEQNQYVGNYYLTMTYELPIRLSEGKLIFKNTDEGCDKNLTTIVDFKNGIPKRFFRKCKGENGDIYIFSTE